MRLLWAAGGRRYTDRPMIRLVLRPYAENGWTLITGAQRGLDLTAEDIWRREFEAPYVGVPARWLTKGRPAGPIRNRVIAKQYQPELLIHFPGGVGTADAIRAATGEHIEVLSAIAEAVA